MAIAATDTFVDIAYGWTFGWTVFLDLVASGSLLRNAVRHGHFEDMSSTVGRSHFTGTRVDTSIRSAGWSSNSPARFSAISCALTVLPIRSDDSLATGQQLHLARGVVHISIGGADGSILRCTVKSGFFIKLSLKWCAVLTCYSRLGMTLGWH